jgi:hypothetical protein
MIAHKRQLTIENPERVVLTGLPFRAGQGVEFGRPGMFHPLE